MSLPSAADIKQTADTYNDTTHKQTDIADKKPLAWVAWVGLLAIVGFIGWLIYDNITTKAENRLLRGDSDKKDSTHRAELREQRLELKAENKATLEENKMLWHKLGIQDALKN